MNKVDFISTWPCIFPLIFCPLAREQARNTLSVIQTYLQDSRRGEIIRSGIRLAIFGPPNAGKSSLLNFLGNRNRFFPRCLLRSNAASSSKAQREAAIVTPVPGTTRDILELSLDIDGLPVIVADTAGLRKTDDVVETIGIEKAKKTFVTITK